MNPLLTPFDTAPFSSIKNEHFMPAFLQAMESARKEIDDIGNSEEEPTFENTIETLEFSGQHLDRIAGLFFNL
ncbi:MAG: M3 family peptidase, partial [Eudoraea sp.]|nr:M3 family peptidase [Eudoraea sp.]